MSDLVNEKIKGLIAEARAQKDAIREQAKPIREQWDAIQAQIHDLEALAKPLEEQFRAIEAPLFDLDNQISGLAATLPGHRRMSDALEKAAQE